MHQNHLEGLLKPRLLGTPRVAEPVGLGWDKFLDSTDAAAGEPCTENDCLVSMEQRFSKFAAY